jgi:hypothetical protein
VTLFSEGPASAQEPNNEVDRVTVTVDGNPASISETQSLSNEPLDVFDEQATLDKWPVAGEGLECEIESRQTRLVTTEFHIDAVGSEENNLLPMRRKSPVEPSNMEQIGPTTSSSYDAQQWSLVPYQNDVCESFMNVQSAYQMCLTYFNAAKIFLC